GQLQVLDCAAVHAEQTYAGDVRIDRGDRQVADRRAGAVERLPVENARELGEAGPLQASDRREVDAGRVDVAAERVHAAEILPDVLQVCDIVDQHVGGQLPVTCHELRVRVTPCYRGFVLAVVAPRIVENAHLPTGRNVRLHELVLSAEVTVERHRTDASASIGGAHTDSAAASARHTVVEGDVRISAQRERRVRVPCDGSVHDDVAFAAPRRSGSDYDLAVGLTQFLLQRPYLDFRSTVVVFAAVLANDHVLRIEQQ